VLLELGDLDDAGVHLERSLALYEGATRKDYGQIAFVLTHLSSLQCRRGKLGEASHLAQRALALRAHGSVNPYVLFGTFDALGIALYRGGRLADAVRHYRDAIATCAQMPDPVQREANLAPALDHLAVALGDLGHDSEAEPMFQDSIARLRQALGDNHPWVADALGHYGGFLLDRDRPAEAEPLFREELASNAQRHGADSVQATIPRLRMGYAMFGRGAREEGLDLVRKALALVEQKLGAHPVVIHAHIDLASLLARDGDAAAAEQLLRTALATATNKLSAKSRITHHVQRELGALLLDRQPQEAVELLAPAFAAARASAGDRRRVLGECAANLARGLCRLDRPEEAETALTSALALFSDQSSDATLPSRRAILAALIELYAAQGRPEAEEYRARLVAARK
jgi:tetratricopeptide (TPR) repeat protein